MKPKYKIDQELWIAIFSTTRSKFETKKIKIIDIRVGTFGTILYKMNIGGEAFEWDFHLTEEESVQEVTEHEVDIFISSKGCLKSELKYFEREYKLKRILNV